MFGPEVSSELHPESERAPSRSAVSTMCLGTEIFTEAVV